jgi:RNA polymerase sigma-70 factor (ECF subfamily)
MLPATQRCSGISHSLDRIVVSKYIQFGPFTTSSPGPYGRGDKRLVELPMPASATEFESDLLRRLCAGDPIAPAEACEHFLPLLLARRGWTKGYAHDEHRVQSAAEDAVFDFVRHPEAYDPTKLSLLSYLRMAARRDLENAERKEARHRSRRAPLEAVELRPPGGNDGQNEVELPGGLTAAELMRRLHQRITDPADRKALALMIDGVRETAPYARIWGIEGLPIEQQRREVKKNKDRLLKQAQRQGRRLRGE